MTILSQRCILNMMKPTVLAGIAVGLSLLSLFLSVMLWQQSSLSFSDDSGSIAVADEEASKIAKLSTAVADLVNRVTKLEQQPSSSVSAGTASEAASPQPVVAQTPPVSRAVNEIIYLGSASTTSRDWTESGVEIVLNSNNYPVGTKMKFEAGLSIIGGEAWARIKNKTTGAIIAVSEVSHNTSTTTWKGSPAFAMHSGSYTYVVELRSTSGETVNMSGSRLILDE
jgi:hypothetical protein